MMTLTQTVKARCEAAHTSILMALECPDTDLTATDYDVFPQAINVLNNIASGHVSDLAKAEAAWMFHTAAAR